MIGLQGLLEHARVVVRTNFVNVADKSLNVLITYFDTEVVSEDFMEARFMGFGLVGKATQTARPFRRSTELHDTIRASLNWAAELRILASISSFYLIRFVAVLFSISSIVLWCTIASLFGVLNLSVLL